MAEHTPVAIVGAGPAGLAVGGCLRRHGIDFIMLEKANAVGSSWRGHYDRLHLHTVKGLSALPNLPFPEEYPRYVPRRSMVDYLDRYAATFDLKPRFATPVQSIRRDDEGWVVEAASGPIEASHVVIASGLNAEPVRPALPGLERFQGEVLHSADYASGNRFTGRDVLVVGMGNTGAEIALDLVEQGARPTLSVRGGVHIVPRDLFGVPIQLVAIASSPMPVALNDAVFPLILDLALGDLSRYGLKRPPYGMLRKVADAGKIPVLDVGTVRAIANGTIKVAGGIDGFDEKGARFADGSRADVDAVVLATGYRPNFAELVEPDEIASVPANGTPVAKRATLHFVGYDSPVTGLLRQIARDAVKVADRIAGAVRAG